MKVALLQLPVQSHDYGYSLENIPFAAGYLKSSAGAWQPGRNEIEICPPAVASLGGDAAILDWIEGQKPEVVGFSCYLWNIERTLHLCREIKERFGCVRIILGGPEISPDNRLLLSGSFDVAIRGEGEEAFADLLAAWSSGVHDLSSIPGLAVPSGGTLRMTARRPPMKNLHRLPSPYLDGAIGRSYTKTIFLETVRGCLYRCSYCSYHKQFRKLRAFDLQRTAAEIRWALQNGVEEISFIDPCFARRPNLKKLLAILSEAQKIGPMKVSCELNAEDLTREMVDELVPAGIRHVEIGLQSTNGEALRLAGRRFDEALFVKGVTMLKAAGVHVATDIMVGLPGDRFEDVKRSLHFVLDNGLYDSLNLYPVSVLPNTLLREKASVWGVSYQDRPPYYIENTRGMSSGDIRACFIHAEEVTGESYFPVELPRMPGVRAGGSINGFVGRISLGPQSGGAPISPSHIGQALAIEITGTLRPENKEELRRLILPILEANPFTLLSFIMTDKDFRPEDALPFLRTLSPGASHPCDREFMSTVSAACSARLFVKTDLGRARHAYTFIPLRGDFTELQAFLPGDAGKEEEEMLSGMIGHAFGRVVTLRFHDLEEPEQTGMDASLLQGCMKI